MVSTTEEWTWEVRLKCGHTFTGRGTGETKDWVREHKVFECPHCNSIEPVEFYSARGL